MKEKIRIGVIGLGQRGKCMLPGLADMQDVEVVLCDEYPDRIAACKASYKEKAGREIIGETTDYKELLARDDVDAIMAFSSWHSHADIAVDAMRAGKYVAIEVGGGYDLHDCYRIVDTYEETGVPCMMLENCCYGRREMMVLNMVKQGLFGEIVHCTGGYMHDLRSTDLSGTYDRHYRLHEYINRNCENYPTHELGPIAKVLGINRGNKMLHLTSMASKAAGMHDYWERNAPTDSPLRTQNVRQGDIITTSILCASGATIRLTLDTTLPRAYYSRDFGVRGTRAMYTEERKVLFMDGMQEEIKENEEEFFAKYDHPLHDEYVHLGEKGGHGGMDWLVQRAFVESVKRGINTPIDAYDTASWMAITPLSEQSVAQGGAPVAIPDFTRGKWLRREPVTEGKYCLDKVCIDKDTKIY